MLLSLLLVALPQQGAAPTPLMTLDSAGPEAWFVDPKDAALLRALQMLDERLVELPEEFPDAGIPEPAMRLLARLAGKEVSLRVGRTERAAPGLPLPVAAELRVAQPGAAEALLWLGDLAALMEEMGAPLEPSGGSGGFALPGEGALWMGASGGTLHLRLGREEGVPGREVDLLPDGVTPYLSGSLAYRELLELVAEADGGGATREQLDAMLAIYGLGGLRLEFAAGTDAERGLAVLRMPGHAAAGRESGMLPSQPLTPEILTAVPEDATWASASAFDLSALAAGYQRLIGELAGEEVDLAALLREETGLDLEADLLACFGRQLVVYASDTTGGGGLMSMAAVAELGDREAFLRTWRRLSDRLEAAGREEMDGHLGVRGFELDGMRYEVLSFLGLPVPFEPCVAVLDRHVVVGVTPQACVAAVRQFTSAERSLLDREDFLAQLPASMEGALKVTWIDSPRLLREGYGLLSMGTSMVANAMRSPVGASREPGVLLPGYRELLEGARPMVSVGRAVGDDYVEETRSDRSHLVNLAGICGYLQGPVLGLVGLGVLGAATEEEFEDLGPSPYAGGGATELEARVAELEAELEAYTVQEEMELELFARMERIYEALDRYAAANDGAYPARLEELAREGAGGARYLDPADLVDPWGDPYLYEPPAEAGGEPFVDFQE
jgi:hypothetical protein